MYPGDGGGQKSPTLHFSNVPALDPHCDGPLGPYRLTCFEAILYMSEAGTMPGMNSGMNPIGPIAVARSGPAQPHLGLTAMLVCTVLA
jgi:hypothetical protein